jgi:hypothetical protein
MPVPAILSAGLAAYSLAFTATFDQAKAVRYFGMSL